MTDPYPPEPRSIPCRWGIQRKRKTLSYIQWATMVHRKQLGLLPTSLHVPQSWVDYFKHYNPDHEIY